MKENIYDTQALAKEAFDEAIKLAQATADIRNADDPDLGETVTSTLDLISKYYMMTRPDTQAGIEVVLFRWL